MWSDQKDEPPVPRLWLSAALWPGSSEAPVENGVDDAPNREYPRFFVFFPPFVLSLLFFLFFFFFYVFPFLCFCFHGGCIVHVEKMVEPAFSNGFLKSTNCF